MTAVDVAMTGTSGVSDDPGTLIFAGGGTGGHIFPALAIAESARAIAPGIAVHVLCSTRDIDRRILEPTGIGFTPVPAMPMGTRPRSVWRLLRSWRPAVAVARGVIENAKACGPVRLISTGGFVSAPCVAAATRAGIEVTLVNLDRTPGLANRYTARHADRVLTTESVAGSGWLVVPPIVRRAVRELPDRDRARAALGLPGPGSVLVVMGGSQGATSINALMRALVIEHRGWFEGWSVVHQCGRGEAEALQTAYASAGVPAVVRDFFDDGPPGEIVPGDLSPGRAPQMRDVWAVADAVIARAGAGTVAEVRATGVPAVFLPYPYHRDQHQRLNALPLSEAGGAVILTDRIDPAATLAEAAESIRNVLTDQSRRASMRAALGTLPACDGADRVAEAVLAS